METTRSPATWMSLVLASDPHGTAILDGNRHWSHGDLIAHARGAADWLDANGVQTGPPVPSLLTTNAHALALVIGGAGSSRPIAPLGTRLTPRELAGCLVSLGGNVLVTEPAFQNLARSAARATGARVVVLDRVQPSDRALSRGSPDDVAFVLHTSGTSGEPKPVPYRQSTMAHRTWANGAILELGPGQVYASASTIHHIAGLGNFAVALGSGTAIAPMGRFSVEEWHRVGALGVTTALLVPTMIEMLLAENALSLPALTLLHYGASAIHPDTLTKVIEALPEVKLVQIFGQTEGSPITVLTPADHRAAGAGRVELLTSVGRAAPGVELRIDQPDATGVGQILARSPYVNLAGPDGWQHTGDLGSIDEDGYLFLRGRLGDRIIRGGENVYPLEVEQVLDQHPGVAEAVVVGVDDRRWGEIVKAVVVAVDPTSPPSEDELYAFVRTHLTRYKLPTVWEFRSELPRNSSGKVLKRLLRGQ